MCVHGWGLLVALSISLAAGSGCAETAIIALAASPQPITYDHGERFDPSLLDYVTAREPASVARGYLFLPERRAVERSMVWTATNTVDRHRPARPYPKSVGGLRGKIEAKYKMIAAMIERRGVAREVRLVQPGARVAATSADLRIYVRLPSARPERPEIPEARHGQVVVATTVVGVDSFAVFAGQRSVVLREDAAITDNFGRRMLDLLARIERVAVGLQRAQ